MPFKKLAKTEEKKVWWPVEIHEPIDGGKTRVHKVKVQYVLVPPNEVSELTDIGDNAFFNRVIAAWEGFQDEAGAEVLRSEEALAEFLDIAYVRAALAANYFQAAAGGRRKN